MKRIAVSRRATVITLALLVILTAAGGLFWYVHTRTPAETPGEPYVPRCSAYRGTYDFYGVDSIKVILDEYSKAVVIATVDDPKVLGESVRSDDPPPRITVNRVLKGDGELHKGDTIPICPGLGYMDLPKGEHPTVLVFLDGKEGDVWVPSLGITGIVPKGDNGRFDLDAITDNPKTVTADELQRLIK